MGTLAIIGSIVGAANSVSEGIPAPQFSAPLVVSATPTTGIGTYTFTRNDADATITNYDDIISNVKADEIRFNGARRVDHADGEDYGSNELGVEYLNTESDDTTPLTAMKGVLIEGERTNDLHYSEEYSNAWWTKSFCVLTANDAVSPDGTTSTDKIDDNSVSFGFISRINAGVVANAETFTYSVFVKKDSVVNTTRHPLLRLSFQGGSRTDMDLTFDTSTGASVSTKTLGSGTLVDGGVESFDADYWFCWITGTNDSSGNTDIVSFFYPAIGNTAGMITYNSAVQGAIHAWGIQLEQGAIYTSHIPTSGAAKDRKADALSYPIANANEAEGTLYCEWIPTFSKAKYIGSNRPLIVMDDTNIPGVLYIDSTAGAIATYDGTTTHVSTYDYIAGETVKIAVRWSEASSTFNIVVNGVAAVEAAFDGWDAARWDDAIHINRDGTAYGTVSNISIWSSA